MYKKIPTYKEGKWSYTEFETQEEFARYLTTLFKEPGQYEFDETALLFNEQATTFNKNGFYCKSCMTAYYKRENEIWECGSFLLYGEGCMGNQYKKDGVTINETHFGGKWKSHGLARGPVKDLRPPEVQKAVPAELQ